MDAAWRFHLGDVHTAESAPTAGFTWRAVEDDRGDTVAQEMANPDFDDKAWKIVTAHENVFKKCTKALYRAKLTSPPGSQRVVYFGGVNDFATTYFRPFAKNNFRNPRKRLARPFESFNTRESLDLTSFQFPILARSMSLKSPWIVDVTTRCSGASTQFTCC